MKKSISDKVVLRLTLPTIIWLLVYLTIIFAIPSEWLDPVRGETSYLLGAMMLVSFITSSICIVMFSRTSKSQLVLSCLVANIMNVLWFLLFIWMQFSRDQM